MCNVDWFKLSVSEGDALKGNGEQLIERLFKLVD